MFGRLRQRARIDLHDRAEQHEMPVGPERRHLAHELDVEPLVDHAEEPDPRMRNAGLVGRIALRLPCAREVRDVHAARERVDLRMQVPLRLVEALAAGQHEIRALHQLRLALPQGGRRAGEGRELVHAVVDHGERLEMPCERQCHRCVVPEHVRTDVLLGEEHVDELSLCVQN